MKHKILLSEIAFFGSAILSNVSEGKFLIYSWAVLAVYYGVKSIYLTYKNKK